MDQRVHDQLKILQSGIRTDVTLVADFFDVDTPLGEYVKELHAYEAPAEHRERQQLLKRVIQEQLACVFTEDELERAHLDWDEDLKVNIVDHHGFLNHALLVSTNIIANAHQLPSGAPQGIVVLSDSGVPLNNFFHKRGLKFRGQQLNFIPHKDRHVVAFAAKKPEQFPLVEAAQRAGMAEDAQTFLAGIASQLQHLAEHSHVQSYKDLVQRVNYTWWKELFAEELRDRIPDLFYVANEDVAAGMLKEYLQDDTHLFSRFLFDPATRDVIVRTFDGVTGCWDLGGTRGSVFFWGVDERGQKIQLALREDSLVAVDSSVAFELELTTDSVLAALREGRVYPTMFLVYGIANFFCGVRPLVGYGSMNYQTAMRESWVCALRELGENEEAQLVGRVPTNGFIGGPLVSFGYDSDSDTLKELYALDLIERGGLSADYLQHLRAMPFNLLLQPALPDIYDSYVRPEHKKEITVTAADLLGDAFGWVKELEQHRLGSRA
ncbi:MAG: hypothetical protein KC925_01700 [Candidatus Doudnabacteria bacterium]|nr:hypothetical protein [Candidatus Doudnabacteria bacterium]